MLLNLYCYVLLCINKEIKTVVEGSCFSNVICINYAYWCPTRFQYHMTAGGLAL
jgi:hypothetical protein